MAYTRRKKYGRRRKSFRGGKHTPLGKKGRPISEKDRRVLEEFYSNLESSPETTPTPIQKPVAKKRPPKEDFDLSPEIDDIAVKRPPGFKTPKTPEGEEYEYTNPKIKAWIKALREPAKMEKSTKVEEPEMVQNAEPVEVPVKKMSRKKTPSRRKHHPPRPRKTKGRTPWRPVGPVQYPYL